MSYLAFLSFIVATGLYWLVGPGGPLHSIDFLLPLSHMATTWTRMDDYDKFQSY